MNAMADEVSHSEHDQFRAVLEAASDAYLCADEAGIVVDGNRAAQRMFEVTRDQLLGADLFGLLTPGPLEGTYRAAYQRLLAHGGSGDPVKLSAETAGRHLLLEVSMWVTGTPGSRRVHGLCRDITERTELQRQRDEDARRLAEAQALVHLGSWEWSLGDDRVSWSAEMHRITGIPEATDLSYRTFTDLLHPDDRDWVEAEIDAVALEGTPLRYEARIVRLDGEVRWIAATGRTVLDDDGVPVRVVGTAQDVTERKHAELELQRLSVTDPLTGLANRTRFDDVLESALADTAATGVPLALLMLDLDGFKPVNDTHGHAVGDAVLVELAERLAACTRPDDTLARLGGDEFALVLPGAEHRDTVRVAERLLDATEAAITIDDGTTVAIGASIGIAVAPDPPSGVGELRREADRALYAAKHNGRGRYEVFTPALSGRIGSTLAVRPRQARAWGRYMQSLRAEIGQRKRQGEIPDSTRAPSSMLRPLQQLLGAIEQLPDRDGEVALPLPEREMLEEFVFHQSMVQDWADGLMDEGRLETRRTPEADAFWARLREAITRPR